MSRHSTIPALLALFIATSLVVPSLCAADSYAPQAPANVSWLPHGYGNTMWVVNTRVSNFKGLHGFRPAPNYIGCWSEPMWGWNVDGFCTGPQVAEPDPGECQLPIGLIYPGSAPPPPPQAVAKVRTPPQGFPANGPMPMGPGPMPMAPMGY
jgi:hypothetical protein